MGNENEQFAHSWDDEDETAASERDPNRPERSLNPPSRRPRPRGVPGSAHFYEEIEGDESAARPRPTRQSREEVEARLRQRARPQRSQEEPRSRSAAQPTRRPLPRSASSSSRYDDYSEDQASYEPRPTRNFARDAPSRRPTRDIGPELPARRPARDFAEMPPRRPTRDISPRRPAPRASEVDEVYDDGYEEIDIIEEPLPRRKRKRSRGRRIFVTLLTGCLGGVLALVLVAGLFIYLAIHNTPLGQSLGGGGTPTFNQSTQQALNLGTATQLLVENQTGNITVNVDPNASSAMLSSVKHVQASSQSAADIQFKQIILNVQQLTQGQGQGSVACPVSACLLVSVETQTSSATPVSNGGLFSVGTGNSVDLTITLPKSFNSPTPNTVTASTNAGNLSVNGFEGVLNLNGKAGNITVAHALIFAGTCLQTQQGDITIAQESLFDLGTPSQQVPCSATTSTDQHPWFNIQDGVGNVNITLTGPNLNSLLLDFLTNRGSITDDFNLNVSKSSDGSDSYQGPLIANTNPTALLYIIASTGNINLHK